VMEIENEIVETLIHETAWIFYRHWSGGITITYTFD
jgi:hypothetical protein